MEDVVIFLPGELSETSFRQLLPDFFEEIKEDFGLLKCAAKENNLEEMLGLVHKIKGSAASYAATHMLEKAIILEQKMGDTNTLNAIEFNEQIHDMGESIEKSYEYAKVHFKIH